MTFIEFKIILHTPMPTLLCFSMCIFLILIIKNVIRNNFANNIAWTSNYKETGKPTDSNKHKLMVEVMSVNDNERSNNKGKIVDPVKIQSKKMIKDLKNTGCLDHLSNNAVILPNSKFSKLSREEFHKVSQL